MPGESFWLAAVAVVAIAVAFKIQRQWNRLTAGYQELKEFADTLVQHGQGTILHVQGIVSELNPENPVRQRIEQVLARAERELSELCETMQPHCSKQQEELIQ